MTETLLMLYTMFAAAGTFALLSLLGAAELRARRRRSRDAALRAKYLRIVMLYLLAGEGPAPRFPVIRRAGARLLLVETVAGLAGVTYGLDAAAAVYPGIFKLRGGENVALRSEAGL